MQYIASLSYGKDSIAMLEIIKQQGMPLDRIVHVEIMATDTIPADLPPMMEFKDKADRVIKERYGIEVEHLRAKWSYEQFFYKRRTSRAKHRAGEIYGFPMVTGAWCNNMLKTAPMKSIERSNVIYIGIAADEPKPFSQLDRQKAVSVGRTRYNRSGSKKDMRGAGFIVANLHAKHTRWMLVLSLSTHQSASVAS